VIQDNNLSGEVRNFFWWIVFGVTTNVTSLDIFNSNIFDIETNIISRDGFL
jgi:hypothetical protein